MAYNINMKYTAACAFGIKCINEKCSFAHTLRQFRVIDCYNGDNCYYGEFCFRRHPSGRQEKDYLWWNAIQYSCQNPIDCYPNKKPVKPPKSIPVVGETYAKIASPKILSPKQLEDDENEGENSIPQIPSQQQIDETVEKFNRKNKINSNTKPKATFQITVEGADFIKIADGLVKAGVTLTGITTV